MPWTQTVRGLFYELPTAPFIRSRSAPTGARHKRAQVLSAGVGMKLAGLISSSMVRQSRPRASRLGDLVIRSDEAYAARELKNA